MRHPECRRVPAESLLHLDSMSVDGTGVKTRVLRLLLPLLASLALSGCFVFDEIQKGIDLMDEHSAADSSEKTKQAEAENTPETESKLPELQAKLAKWWSSALEEEPPPPGADNGIVRCDVHGKVSFTRASDCTIRGGRLVSR